MQIVETKEAGASAVLLIVAVLGNKTAHFVRLCEMIGLECLVEIHNKTELEIALDSGTVNINYTEISDHYCNTFPFSSYSLSRPP